VLKNNKQDIGRTRLLAPFRRLIGVAGLLSLVGLFLLFMPAHAQTGLNLLRGGPTGGIAVPVQIAGTGGATPYKTVLTAWADSYAPPNALYDQGTHMDNEDFWSNNLGSSLGTTWSGAAAGAGVGQLVVDLQSAKTIDRFSVFQMFADGKTTHIQFFMHANTGATPPDAGDAGWVAVAAESAVGAGVNDTANTRISSPTKITVPSFTTRYL